MKGRYRWFKAVSFPDMWILRRGRKTMAQVALGADGWHVLVYDNRPLNTICGWFGCKGFFRYRAQAMRATLKLVKASLAR